jgi:hypothetical protein
MFKDRFPEEWLKCVVAFHEIEYLVLLKEHSEKNRMF